jgi:hypothetical protein
LLQEYALRDLPVVLPVKQDGGWNLFGVGWNLFEVWNLFEAVPPK